MRTWREIVGIHHVDVDVDEVEWCSWGSDSAARITRVVIHLVREKTGQQIIDGLPAVSIHLLLFCGRCDSRRRGPSTGERAGLTL